MIIDYDRLNDRVEEFISLHFSNARKNSGKFYMGNKYGEAGDSLCINLNGGYRGKWTDFATSESGDVMDLIKAKFNDNIEESYKFAESFLGVLPSKTILHQRSATKTKYNQEDKSKQIKACMGEFWNKPSIALNEAKEGKPNKAMLYLKSRNLDITKLQHVSSSIRYHPKAYYGWVERLPLDFNPTMFEYKRLETGYMLYAPAMTCQINNFDGNFKGVHKTFLWYDSNNKIVKKLPVEKPKKIFGSMQGSFIYINRSINKKWADKDFDSIVIGEGVEDCLTYAIHEDPDAMVICGLNIGNLKNIQFPPCVKHVFFIRQNPGTTGEDLLCDKTIDGWNEQYNVHIIKTRPEYKDINDMYMDIGAINA